MEKAALEGNKKIQLELSDGGGERSHTSSERAEDAGAEREKPVICAEGGMAEEWPAGSEESCRSTSASQLQLSPVRHNRNLHQQLSEPKCSKKNRVNMWFLKWEELWCLMEKCRRLLQEG